MQVLTTAPTLFPTGEHPEAIRYLFESIDIDNSGEVSLDELERAVRPSSVRAAKGELHIGFRPSKAQRALLTPGPLHAVKVGTAAHRAQAGRHRSMSGAANSDPLITLAIMAMGGEGGGVLADWLVDLAEHNGYLAQTTSVPGVAQRTGATIYYLEMFPLAQLPEGRQPVMALSPFPGAVDMVDFPAWQPVPDSLAGRAVHVHNRLIASATSAPPLRRAIAREIAARLGRAQGPTCLLLPRRGVEAWDLPGEPLHDPEGLVAFSTELQACMVSAERPPGLEFQALDLHINDDAFCEAALQVFDRWVAEGKVSASGAVTQEQGHDTRPATQGFPADRAPA